MTPPNARSVEIISPDVECSWCGAKPGEPCRIQDSSPEGWRFSYREGHTGRTKTVRADSPEVGRGRAIRYRTRHLVLPPRSLASRAACHEDHE